MKKSQSTALRRIAVAVLGFAAILIVNSSARAQGITDGSTPLALAPGSPAGSYSLSDFDSVSLYNGNLGFSLPLVKIAGRGGAGYTMAARVEQKWLVDKEPRPGQPNLYTPIPNWWNIDGFIALYSVGRMDSRQAGSKEYSILNPCGYVHNQTLTRLTFTAPDGTEFELRDQLTNGQPKQPTSCDGFNRGRVFVTADGSSATFTSDSDISDYNCDNPANVPPSGGLAMRDGTHYRIDGGVVSWMRDRNGNKVTFSYDTNHRLTTISDSLNRQISITYGQLGAYDQITLKGFGGATRTIKVYQSSMHYALRSDFSLQTYQQLFPELNGAYSGAVDPPIISAIELPNGQQYHFYYNSYAELARVVLPTGGAIEYDYAAGLTDGAASGVLPSFNGDKHIYRRVIERRVYPDGASGAGYASRTTYSRPESSTSNSGYVVADQFNASGTLLNRSQHYFYGSARASFNQQPTEYGGWKDGREYQTTVFGADGTTALRQVTNVFAQRASVSWWTGSADQEPPNDPRLVETSTTLVDANQVSKQTLGYDDSVPFNNQNNVKEYDFGSGAPGALVRETRTTLVTSTIYTGAAVSLLSLPSQVSIYDAGGVERARTTFEYDNYNSDTNHAGLIYRSNISGMDSSFSTSYTTRGNVTASTHYLLVNGSVTGSVASYGQYDIAGNLVKAIDARGYAATFDYNDRFGSPDGDARSNSGSTELGGQYSYAFPTLVTNALGHTAYTQLDFYLGRAVDSEDANGVVSSGYYNDSLDRPTQVVRAANQGSSVKSQTTFTYDDTNRIVTTTSDQTSYNDNALKTQIVYDAMGRTTDSRQYEGGSNYISVQTQYDSLGRAYKTSNPFRSYLGEQATWNTAAFDALSRVTSVTTSDSAPVTSSYSGNTVTVTDQTGKARRSVTDGLGRLVQVYEDPSGLNYLTSYSYDTLDNLTGVSQVDPITSYNQTRTFAYDSFKRLTSATNPESGTVSYSYDNNGNLAQKTDARGVVSSYGYDALNRNVAISYSDGTMGIGRAYDQTTNGKGRLSWEWQCLDATHCGSTESFNYDALGRVVNRNQAFFVNGAWGTNFGVYASYDLAGHIKTETYPSNHAVTYNYDGAGRLADNGSNLAVTGNLGDGVTRTYAKGITYDAGGRMTRELFGTDTLLYHNSHYNVRGQLYDTRVGSGTDGNGSEFTWNRGCLQMFYTADFTWGASGPSNNGNLLRALQYLPNGEDQITSFAMNNEDYTYDSLNRLTSASEGSTYRQSYIYDRYGNRTIDAANTSGGVNAQQFSVTASNNRLGVPSGQSGTMTYDNAGNLLNDTYSGQGQRTYDAENRMTAAQDIYSGWTYYTYDAGGSRVRRKINNQETWQIYGIGGELLAEYAQNGSPTSPQKEYGYRSGQLLVTATNTTNDIQWLVTDQLGTPRMIFDKTGSLAGTKRHDYLPFGEELYAGIGSRSSALGYTNSDGARQKFTQKERDTETGLDYFGARYYGSTQGRFTSPDPLLSSGRSLQPQSWNRYTYVLNRPLSLVDLNGLDWGVAEWDDKDKVHHIDYQWFNGEIGSYNGQSYTAVNFGGDASRTIDLSDGRTIRISNDRSNPLQDMTAHPQAEQAPVLPPSWMDHVPVLSTTRGFLFDYTTQNFEGALVDFASLSGQIGSVAATGAISASADATAAAAEGGATTLYRAVGQAEYEQIMETGTFEAGPNSLGGKWFAESAEHANQWGELLEGKGAFKVVDAKIPTVQADQFMRLERLDGIGPARYAELKQLTNAVVGKGP